MANWNTEGANETLPADAVAVLNALRLWVLERYESILRIAMQCCVRRRSFWLSRGRVDDHRFSLCDLEAVGML